DSRNNRCSSPSGNNQVALSEDRIIGEEEIFSSDHHDLEVPSSVGRPPPFDDAIKRTDDKGLMN
ncbi:hypothetical protein EVAR_94257_1, partial [Eumeta japonica]